MKSRLIRGISRAYDRWNQSLLFAKWRLPNDGLKRLDPKRFGPCLLCGDPYGVDMTQKIICPQCASARMWTQTEKTYGPR